MKLVVLTIAATMLVAGQGADLRHRELKNNLKDEYIILELGRLLIPPLLEDWKPF